MTKDEANVLKAIKASANSQRKHEEKIKAARAAVQRCSHPEEALQDYHWESDDGYGCQAWRIGKRCAICNKVSMWYPHGYFE